MPGSTESALQAFKFTSSQQAFKFTSSQPRKIGNSILTLQM